MRQILDLREKRAKAWDAAKAFLDTKRGDDGTLSAEDAAVYDKMEASVVNLGHEVERLERQAAMDMEMNQPTAQPMMVKPGMGEHEVKTGRGSDAYKTAFWRVLRQKSVPHEVFNALQIGVQSEGGYTVPDEFEHALVEALQEENIMRGLVHVIKTSSGDRKIPLVTTKGSAFWVEEEAAISESDDAFGQITLSAHKVGSMIRISEELLNDSAFDLATYITREFARRVGAAEEEAILTGDGSHKPTGLLHASLGAEPGVTAAALAAITADELIDLQHSLKAGYRRRASYIMNDATVKLLRKLKDGNGQYLWQPGLLLGQPDTLLNQKVLTSNYMPLPAAGNAAILYGDFSYYWLADREGHSLQRLNELYAATDQVGFKITQRVDGRLILREAVKTLTLKAS
jgi:HK97 family phage major capsid protein